MKEKEFAIITAYRKYIGSSDQKRSKDDNIKRNRNLRAKLDSKRLGVQQLVGHWRECKKQGIEYKDCPASELEDTIERSYLVPKPDSMSSDDFKKIILDLMTIDGETQDGVVLKTQDGLYIMNNKGHLDYIGKDVTVGKISQAYSQYVKKLKQPFVFEYFGAEYPSNEKTNYLMSKNNILFTILSKESYTA